MKIKSNDLSQVQLLIRWIALLLAALPLAACSQRVEPQDTYFPSQDFSVSFNKSEGQIRAGLLMFNPGEREVPADYDFEGAARLWDPDGNSLFRVDTHYLSPIGPGETREVTWLKWSLEPGIYFLAWGSPNYGGVLDIFNVEYLSGMPEVVRSLSFQIKPINYDGQYDNCGMIKDFSLAKDGSLFVSGESPLPDQSCLYPLLFSDEGLVEGFPFGECVQIAEGKWFIDLPADPGNIRIELEEDTNYHLIVFSNDIKIPPSDPFEILISPPASQ